MANPHNILCVYFIQHSFRIWCVSYFKSACMLLFALSYLGRQNELTFVGAISLTFQKNELFVHIRLFLNRGSIQLYLVQVFTKHHTVDSMLCFSSLYYYRVVVYPNHQIMVGFSSKGYYSDYYENRIGN